MKSVGEVMGIGRSFQALHKATQSLEIKEMV
jgi:carbamoylphosphate synthase large subunit